MSDPQELERIAAWLLESTGLVASLLGMQRLARAVEQRRQRRSDATPGSYLALLQADPAERQELLERLLVGETWFWREPQALTRLQALPRRPSERPLRLLSCGCSSGEEPYSAVMALLEAGWPLSSLQVEAIDLSAEALQRAAEGRYSDRAVRQLQPAQRARYFRAEEGGWRLQAPIRSAVRLHHGPLLQELARLPGGWDVVFCRNVMLYLSPEARLELLGLMADRLAPTGVLEVAIAEAPMVPADRFRPVAGPEGAAFSPRPEAVPQAVVSSCGPARTREPLLTPAPAVAPQPEDRLSLEPADHLARAHGLRARGRISEAMAAVRCCLYLDPERLEALDLAVTLAGDLGQTLLLERLARRRSRRMP